MTDTPAGKPLRLQFGQKAFERALLKGADAWVAPEPKPERMLQQQDVVAPLQFQESPPVLIQLEIGRAEANEHLDVVREPASAVSACTYDGL